jgi:hypothetical protein
MKKTILHVAMLTAFMSFCGISPAFAVEVVNKSSNVPTEKDAVDPSSDTPWSRRMEDVTGLFGVQVKGTAASAGGGIENSTNFTTFQPWQEDAFNAASAYGSTTVGFGCDGMNLGGVIDGQLAQYGNMISGFISQAPTMAIMYLAYSQPVVKAVIDEMNTVGQFGLDLSNMTCSNVRNLADKSYEEKMQAVAEADCTADAGYKSAECISGDGLTSQVTKTMRAGKEMMTSRTSSLMKTMSSATGGFIKPKSAAAGGTGGTGSSGSSGSSGGAAGGSSGNGSSSAPVGKNCSDVDVESGTTPMILAASELTCKDIKKYSTLLPSFVMTDTAQEVIPRTVSVEDLSKEITNEHMDLLKTVYESDSKTYTETEAFKNLVNRADIVVTRQEVLFMQEMAKKNPAQAVQAQRQLATLSMLKELEIIIGKIEIGVQSGLSNQIDQEFLSNRVVGQYDNSLSVMRKELALLKAKIESDRMRSETLSSILNGGRG